MADRGADAGSPISQHRYVETSRQCSLLLGETRLYRVDCRNDICSRLALDRQDDRGSEISQCAQPAILCAVHDASDLGHAHRGTVAEGDDQSLIFVYRQQLVVGIDLVGAGWAIEAALRRICVGIVDSGAERVERDPLIGQRLRVGLDADRRTLATRESDKPNACNLRALLAPAACRRAAGLPSAASFLR